MSSPLSEKAETISAPDGSLGHCVFISFSSKDLPTAERVWRELEVRHIPCWISSRHIQPGDDFQQSIVNAMERAKVCVLIFSAQANQSPEIKKELAVANHMGLAIMPVRIEDTQASGAMRYQLTNRQFVDLFTDWDESLTKLAAAIRAYGRASETSAIVPDDADAGPLSQFSEADLSQTADRLALYLGPIASILVKQAAAQAASLADLHVLLAEQIANDRERLSFLQSQPTTTPPRRRPWRLIGLGTAAVATVIILAWQALDGQPPQEARREAAPTREGRPPQPLNKTAAAPAVVAKPPPATVAEPQTTTLKAEGTGATPLLAQEERKDEVPAVYPALPKVQGNDAIAPEYRAGEVPPAIAEQREARDDDVQVAGPAVPASASVQAPAAAPPASLRDCNECPEMLLVPAGEFLMGAPEGDALADPEEKPQRRAIIGKSFYLAAYEVSFDEWRACTAAGGCRGHKPANAGWGGGRRPVVNVSWIDAQAYAAWLSTKSGYRYRLPTEEEWEYAARGGSTTRYIWGDAITRGDANCNGCNSKWDNRQTAPVGSFKANAFGLYDMLGNVWEWTADCLQPEARAISAGAAPTESAGRCGARVLRGGSWANSPAVLRSSARIWGNPDGRTNNVGFRVARDGEGDWSAGLAPPHADR